MELEIKGITYEVRELKYKEIKPFLNQEDETEIGEMLLMQSVYVNNEPLGDDLMELGFGTFQKLQKAVLEEYGIGEGND